MQARCLFQINYAMQFCVDKTGMSPLHHRSFWSESRRKNLWNRSLLAANGDFIAFFNADITQKGHGAEASVCQLRLMRPCPPFSVRRHVVAIL